MTTPAFSRTFAYDAATGYPKRAPGSAAVVATAYIGTQTDQGAAAITDMVAVINVEAADVQANSLYTFRIIGSNVADRSDGQVLAMTQLGNSTAISPGTVAAAAGDHVALYFRTERNRTAFRYVDLHLTVAGANGSITFSAYFSKQI